MSMLSTLAKVAVGVAVAKGVGGILKSKKGQSSGGLLGTLRDQLGSSNSSSKNTSGGGIHDLLASVLGGGNSSQSSGSGGLGGLLNQLGGSGAAAGGLGGLLGGLMGSSGAAAEENTNEGKSFGELFNQSIQSGKTDVAPTKEQEGTAGLMLRAMIQAAKSDGKFDKKEQELLMGKLGDASDEEQKFVKKELKAPVDVKALAKDVPSGLEQQVYAMSLMAIVLDDQSEANYLHELAAAMNIDKKTANAINDKLGVPKLYS